MSGIARHKAITAAVRSDPLERIAQDWARIGLWLSVASALDVVDVEALIVRTARVARTDERLFVGAASWLAAYHGWVNGRRLVALATALAKTDPIASAAMGAMLTLATTQTALSAPELAGAIERCRPIKTPRPLFAVIEQFPTLRSSVREHAAPLYRQWGFWHDDTALKPSAIRPADWLLRHVPELRVRAIVGPSLEADLDHQSARSASDRQRFGPNDRRVLRRRSRRRRPTGHTRTARARARRGTAIPSADAGGHRRAGRVSRGLRSVARAPSATSGSGTVSSPD